MSERSGDETDCPKVAKGFRCADCHGDLLVVDYGSTDASRWERHECRDCGKEGEYYNSHNPDTPRYEGVTERFRNLSTDGGTTRHSSTDNEQPGGS